MYLAPLNYDRFFKKVFSHLDIAKRFLEDFLGVHISEIELLKDRHFLTDDSSKVEFDFRCCIDGVDVIVDMQQWYKSDVVQRFYTYHTAGTVLQLENIPEKGLSLNVGDKKLRSKDYKALKPIITLIWMVDDNLGFQENFVGYNLAPETALEFIRNKELWENPKIIAIVKEREKVLKVMQNDVKDLGFLAKNKLIFIFQKNIVKDTGLSSYHSWFRFAEKTKDVENTEMDFEEYREDPVFKEIIRLINKRGLSKDDMEYIVTEAQRWEEFNRYQEGEYKMWHKDGRKLGLEEGRKLGLEEGEKLGLEKGRELERETQSKKSLEEKRSAARVLRQNNVPTEIIMQATGLSKEEIEDLG